jgi:endonuclease/exonuclease/phosphatase family metal-dependent hydrolase
MQEVIRRITERGPHFLCGDFNTPGFLGRRSRGWLPPALRILRNAGYHDAFDAVGIGPGHTFPAGRPFLRIDFLFFPTRWASGLRSARTVGAPPHASDHRPVMAEWRWPDVSPV